MEGFRFIAGAALMLAIATLIVLLACVAAAAFMDEDAEDDEA